MVFVCSGSGANRMRLEIVMPFLTQCSATSFEFDGSVVGQIQHLCWIQEGDEHVSQVWCAGVTTSL